MFFGRIFFLIMISLGPGSPHVRPLRDTSGEPNEIELAAADGLLYRFLLIRYWNHNVLQMAVRQRIGMTVIPWSFTDPAYGCFPPMSLSMSGGKPQKAPIEDTLEYIRGAFVLHTRGYNVPKPLKPTCNFARLYAKVKQGALDKQRNNVSLPVPVVGLGPRTAGETAHFRKLISSRGHNVVEPSFIPPHPYEVVTIEAVASPDRCLASTRPRGLGDTTALLLKHGCKHLGEVSHWMWHTPPASGGDAPLAAGGHVRTQQGGQAGVCVRCSLVNVRGGARVRVPGVGRARLRLHVAGSTARLPAHLVAYKVFVEGSRWNALRRVSDYDIALLSHAPPLPHGHGVCPRSRAPLRLAPAQVRPALRDNMGGGIWGRIMCLTGENWRKSKSPTTDNTPLTMVGGRAPAPAKMHAYALCWAVHSLPRRALVSAEDPPRAGRDMSLPAAASSAPHTAFPWWWWSLSLGRGGCAAWAQVCNPERANQRWVRKGGTIYNPARDMCLGTVAGTATDVSDAHALGAASTGVLMQPCTGGRSQQWKFTRVE